MRPMRIQVGGQRDCLEYAHRCMCNLYEAQTLSQYTALLPPLVSVYGISCDTAYLDHGAYSELPLM